MRKLLKLILLSEVIAFAYRWLRWLDWHRKDRQGLKVWQDVWAWIIYQAMSGYPPGELHHWYDTAPPFLFHPWREHIARMPWKEKERFYVEEKPSQRILP